MIIEIQDVLVSSDIITEEFCCDLEACHGQCCIEGDAGAPVTLDEVMEMENHLDDVWENLSASAQAVIDKQGVSYIDQEGDMVTSIVNGKDCVFTCYGDLDIDGKTVKNCCLCSIEKHKPISCALYPIREKKMANGMIGLNYHFWNICEGARKKGKELHLPIYKFLKVPLIRRFGESWYNELCTVADELKKQGYS